MDTTIAPLSTEVVSDADMASGPSVPRQADSDEQAVAIWLSRRPANTRKAYLSDYVRFREFCRLPLQQVAVQDVQAFAESLDRATTAGPVRVRQLSQLTKNRILASVKSLLAFGHRIGYLRFNVGDVIQITAAKDELAQRILPEAAVLRLIELEPRERNRTLLRLLYASGGRSTEIRGLRWSDVQPGESGDGQITLFGKGSKTRAVFLRASVFGELQKLRCHGSAESDFVFLSNKKMPLSHSQVLRIVRAAARRAGITADVSAHWMRHAHASHALDRGAPIHMVQSTLGHASVATTGRYAHARPKDSSSRYLAV